MDSRVGSSTSARLVLALFAVVVMTTETSAQLAGAAGIGASVPAWIGPFEVRAGATVDRIGSSVTPRTALNVRSSIALPVGSGGGWLGVSALQAREVDSLVVRPLIAGGLWQSFRSVTVRIEAASHVARLGGRPPLATTVSVQAIDASGNVFTNVDTTGIDSGVPSRTRFWSDLEAGGSWASGRYRFDATLGIRPAVEGFHRAMWGRVANTTQVASRLALVTAIGIQPTQIALGVPASRFASIAVNVAPGRRASGHDLAPPPVATPFSVRPEKDGRYRVAYRVMNAYRVEISGDFAKWEPVRLDEAEPGLWMTTVALAPGTYHMSVRIDGGPWTAPPGTTTVGDDFNGTVGIVVVR